jgi:phosphoribosylglycinamide formyltransferase
MIHYVVEEVDSGECLVFQEIPMQKGESLEDLEARIHQEEWVLIVEGIKKAISRFGREC